MGPAATVTKPSNAPIARKFGSRHFLGLLWRGLFLSDFKEFLVKDYSQRPEDVINAVRSLRRSGMDVGMPFQTPDGTMIFKLGGYTLSVAQILELLDRNQLDREGIRALAEAQGGKK